jgi:YidC/Oxa1 family membrane protein insertase
MADKVNGKSGVPVTPGEKQELSMEKRLLIAFGLMGLVMLGSQYLMPTAPVAQKAAQKTEQKAPEQQAAAQPAAEASQPKPPTTAAAKTAQPATVIADTVERASIVVESDVYRIVFTNRGATLKSWILKNYKDSNGKPVELVSLAGEKLTGRPFSYLYRNRKPPADLNNALFQVKQPAPGHIEFEYSDGRTSAKKVFHFEKSLYRARLISEVNEDGQALPHLLAWRGGFGDLTAHNAVALMHSVHYDNATSKLVVEEAKIAKEGPVLFSGSFGFAGLEDAYFAAVILPEPGQTTDFQTWMDTYKPSAADDEIGHVGVAFGTQGPIDTTLFVGPKDLDLLRKAHPRLEQLVDWGWFSFIAKPLFLFLNWFDNNYTHNWGWAIVIVTLIINTVLLPLRFTSMRSAQKMAKLQPRIQALNDKYKGISMKDPRKQKQNEEMMELYKTEGINPLGGCVPMLLQMPFFFAFFKVLSVAIELRGAPWLWVGDLSQPEASMIRWLPILMLITQVLMQKMTPTAGGDQSQQKMMMTIMPIVLVVMFYSASSGLVLYWLTGNVVGIVQQYAFNKLAPVTSPVQAATAKKKK